MKNKQIFSLLIVFALLISSCGVFKKGQGCPTNGKNVGAEKLLDGSKPPKAKKFRA